MTHKQRYQQAYDNFQAKAYPEATKNFGTMKAKPATTDTANGLTRYVLNFLTWSGHRATRIISAGRMIDVPQTQKSGVSLMTKKYIPGQTRKGTADISATIKGRSVMIEIKVGKDKPSEFQLREQGIERKAGGVYEFISTPDQFIEWYDGFIANLA